MDNQWAHVFVVPDAGWVRQLNELWRAVVLRLRPASCFTPPCGLADLPCTSQCSDVSCGRPCTDPSPLRHSLCGNSFPLPSHGVVFRSISLPFVGTPLWKLISLGPLWRNNETSVNCLTFWIMNFLNLFSCDCNCEVKMMFPKNMSYFKFETVQNI